MTVGPFATHSLTSTALVQRLIRAIYPYGSIRRIRRGPLKDFRLSVSPSMGFTYIWDMEGGAWDWVRLVGAGQCVYDIGANSGQSTLHLARAVGREGRVIAFEPVPSTFQRMARNVALNALSQVTPVCAAASNAEGDAEFEFNEQRSAQGRLIPLGQGNTRSNEFRAIKVKQLRLDSYGTQGWPPPSFMKIDVEGGAPAVLEGAQNLIATCRPTIYVELHSPDEQAAIRDLLKDHRYRATSLSGQIVEDPAAQWISPLLCRPA